MILIKQLKGVIKRVEFVLKHNFNIFFQKLLRNRLFIQFRRFLTLHSFSLKICDELIFFIVLKLTDNYKEMQYFGLNVFLKMIFKKF